MVPAPERTDWRRAHLAPSVRPASNAFRLRREAPVPIIPLTRRNPRELCEWPSLARHVVTKPCQHPAQIGFAAFKPSSRRRLILACLLYPASFGGRLAPAASSAPDLRRDVKGTSPKPIGCNSSHPSRAACERLRAAMGSMPPPCSRNGGATMRFGAAFDLLSRESKVPATAWRGREAY